MASAALPLTEQYQAARTGAGLCELPDRDVLAVTGPLRVKFLQNLLSNDVASRSDGQGCLAALLDVKGHIQALMRVLVTADSVLLELPASRVAATEAALIHYRVAAPVRFAARPTALLGLVGPMAAEVLAKLGLPAPAGKNDHATAIVTGQAVRVVNAPDLPSGFVLHAPPEHAADISDALMAAGASRLGRETFDVLRVESGRLWFGVDVTEQHLLHETGRLAEYHSSTKGCYIGQEVVARLDGRGGHVNKQLRGLRLTAPASAGTPVMADGKDVGVVTTAVVSPRLGPIALGYVHRTRAGPGTSVDVAGAAASVVALPFADAGAA